MARQQHSPSEKTRAEVSALAGFGVREDEIALYLKIDPKTLRKHYRAELDIGHVRANVAVARSLFKQAVDDSNTAASIFWLKARAGWRDRPDDVVLEHDQPTPVKVEVVVQDARKQNPNDSAKA